MAVNKPEQEPPKGGKQPSRELKLDVAEIGKALEDGPRVRAHQLRLSALALNARKRRAVQEGARLKQEGDPAAAALLETASRLERDEATLLEEHGRVRRETRFARPRKGSIRLNGRVTQGGKPRSGVLVVAANGKDRIKEKTSESGSFSMLIPSDTYCGFEIELCDPSSGKKLGCEVDLPDPGTRRFAWLAIDL